jgi:hypothetical protein
MNIILASLPDNLAQTSFLPLDSHFMNFALRFLLNFGVLVLLIRWLYYSSTRRKDYLLSYFLIGNIIFFLSYLLSSIGMQMGFAIGLFAVFGIIRYRTFAMPVREMTYLFMVIGISVVNALCNFEVNLPAILFANLFIVALTFALEKLLIIRHESCKQIVYEKIELIRTENRQQLIEDLQLRTGIEKIDRIEVGQINFLKDSAILKVYYVESGKNINMADNLPKNKEEDEE